jgi:hypothetical protein
MIDVQESRLEARIAELARRPVLHSKALVDLLEELARDRVTLERWHQSTDVVDGFRLRLLEACERAADHLGWLPPSEIAELVGKDTETVRRWCRNRKVLFRDGPRGYMVNVESALAFAGVKES